MKKAENLVHLEGRLYDYKLETKQVTNATSANFGKKYIAGTVDIATDDPTPFEEGPNIVTYTVTYATELTKAGQRSKTFSELTKIMTSGKTWVKDGPEEATFIKVDRGQIGLNEFYSKDGSLVSQKTSSGGFIETVSSIASNVADRNKWKADVVINKVTRIEADEERHIAEDYVSVNGAVFSYNGSLLPFDFVAESADAMEYFESLDASAAHPVFIKLWGSIVNKREKISKKIESAFGGEEAASVDYSERVIKKYVITGALPVDEDNTFMTTEELSVAVQNRNVYLADIKKRREDYDAAKTTQTATPAQAVNSEFNF